ncbi:GIY-YIG nuclease family protein [Paraburkholderia sp. UCT31]|uniref:GIY-YIG nuclease family protein n=1 Tax=Paraburkholderia sp. UCT31 TaxID=2615209 RepID=UPI0016559A36|nr:GIY-YIG nuclease family protein [Paraburkholderia sp. UCT31]
MYDKPLPRAAQHKLQTLYLANTDYASAAFVDFSLELLRRGIDLAGVFFEAEEAYASTVVDGLSGHFARQRGFIYLATNPVYRGTVYKVGLTRQRPDERMRSLATAGVLGHFMLVKDWPSRDVQRSEIRAHQALAAYNVQGEFFEAHYTVAIAAIDDVLLEERGAFDELYRLCGMPSQPFPDSVFPPSTTAIA